MAGTWFDDAEIYQWFAANVHRVREPSLRHYVRARELKAAGMDWTEVLAAEAENKRARIAAELLASDAYGSTAERVKAFVEQGEDAGRRSSTTAVIYFRRLRRLCDQSNYVAIGLPILALSHLEQDRKPHNALPVTYRQKTTLSRGSD